MLNLYGDKIGVDGIPAYSMPSSSQSKQRFINNDMGNSFYGDNSTLMKNRNNSQMNQPNIPSGVDQSNKRNLLSRDNSR